jgi:hypothetical protein
MAPTARGFTSVLAQRREPPDALDYFPTPPWATRALFRHVLPALGIEAIQSVWEPACAEGHMAAVASEFTPMVIATDIFDYGYGTAPHDFLYDAPPTRIAWIITNPPFKIACEFALRALELATEGVALLVRTQWIEGGGRYQKLFRDQPPALYAPFVERVAMVKGRWDPNASTATSYGWFVWSRQHAAPPPRIFWIPPHCRATLTHANDPHRFVSLPDAPLSSPRFLHVDDSTSDEADRLVNLLESAP